MDQDGKMAVSEEGRWGPVQLGSMSWWPGCPTQVGTERIE